MVVLPRVDLVHIVDVLLLAWLVQVEDVHMELHTRYQYEPELIVDAHTLYSVFVFYLAQHTERVVTHHNIHCCITVNPKYSCVFLVHYHLLYFTRETLLLHLVILFVLRILVELTEYHAFVRTRCDHYLLLDVYLHWVYHLLVQFVNRLNNQLIFL